MEEVSTINYNTTVNNHNNNQLQHSWQDILSTIHLSMIMLVTSDCPYQQE